MSIRARPTLNCVPIHMVILIVRVDNTINCFMTFFFVKKMFYDIASNLALFFIIIVNRSACCFETHSYFLVPSETETSTTSFLFFFSIFSIQGNFLTFFFFILSPLCLSQDLFLGCYYLC